MLTEGQVVVHESLGDEEQRLRRLVLKGPIARTAQAGQFVAIQVQDSSISSFDPLLRRPISIAGISSERDEITLLYRIQGRGTEILARAKCGDKLSVMGPLGKGFSLPEKGELWLVAGGIGIFPLYPLAHRALTQGLTVRLFWGGENKSFLESAGLSSWKALGIPLHLSTLDGSLGQKGLVTGQAQELLEKSSAASGGHIRAAACGPKKMMQAVTELCKNYKVSVEVSLEERMGCAVGACLGCVCTLIDEAGVLIHKKVCQDGPVFRGEEVVWDESC
ncbi:dihydroorotate dehydrogenase electron transfer subunit [Desulfosporosinus nitroreducens]|uniref:Dihydroorotate dehydrogenase electron transfer subunit n=1 Tax=Desulfosporosinus nitroreducens TaxID=2018668 RepID=A0ABT8QMC9_9FIRM|nr:dihydroorotate dehydrogenase electron transfer subunit [Desulfosporosinus nitroreducens]MCO1601203.1 dihydroorotate dehydrogenase electron transfer subunit [Desulfosporosinus nitroreducens]MDO0821704.1 dihydroorotate dehydrogenase electron transfer subunit [Desulfosporosinus nitroreducens]